MKRGAADTQTPGGLGDVPVGQGKRLLQGLDRKSPLRIANRLSVERSIARRYARRSTIEPIGQQARDMAADGLASSGGEDLTRGLIDT